VLRFGRRDARPRPRRSGLAPNGSIHPDELAGFDLELADWVAAQIDRAFGGDLRYMLIRLRSNDRFAAAQALTDDDIAATVILADALHERSRA
jgi:hypothetical protein